MFCSFHQYFLALLSLLFSFRIEINIIRKKSAILASLAALEYTSVPVATLVPIITRVIWSTPYTTRTLALHAFPAFQYSIPTH